MSGLSFNIPASLPARYYWHAGVPAAARDVRADDPTGIAVPAQNKRRPAIGVMAGVTGNLVYIDSRNQTQIINAMVVGQYYPADIQQLVGSTGSNVVPVETGTPAAVTSTATKLTLYWQP